MHISLRTALATLGICGAVALSGCGGNDPAATPPSSPPAVLPSATSSPAAPPAATSPAATSPATTRPVATRPASPVCRNDDVSATVTFQPQFESGTTRLALVAVTNRSKNPCRVDGRAAISLTNAAGEVVEVPTKNVNEPGRAVPITLQPGGNAFEGIKWQLCDKGSADCPAGTGLRFNLQASTDGPDAKLSGFPTGFTMASLQIGTLQPSTQGVVAW
nr:DUF4232 domain-containing protein [uncultured Actinoplanes sp.]